MTIGPTPAHAETAPVEAVPVADPVAVSPLAPVPMMVGHAEDRAEHEADAMADSALARLRSAEGSDTHQHGPGCEHGQIHRSAASPSGAAVVGYEGGALDSSTSGAIEARRGSGRALDADVRRRMETAFSRDFSSVRIHDDAHAAKLSSAISASAFTTGKDIFFGARQYDPASAGGERMLAHELAHTLQPAGSAHRSVSPAAAGSSPRAQAAILRTVATHHTIRRGVMNSISSFFGFGKKSNKVHPEEAAPVAAPAAPTSAYAGNAGKLPSNLEERGKVGVAGGILGGSKIAAEATAKTSSAASAASPLGGLTGAATGFLTTADALMGVRNAAKMEQDAATYGDLGMSKLADRKDQGQRMQALGGAIGTAKGGVEMGLLANVGKTGVKAAVADGVAHTALGTAAGALGVATGSVQTLQGLWKGGKALQKLHRLYSGRAEEMLSARGKDRWKKAVVGAEEFKAKVSAVKVAAGVLGIAAGALLIVSNPVGWIVGLTAAIVGGAYAATKIIAKINDASKRTEIAKQIVNGVPPAEAAGVEPEAEPKTGKAKAEEVMAEEKRKAADKAAAKSRGLIAEKVKESTTRAATKSDSKVKGKGPAKGKAKEVGGDEVARIQAIEMANEVARRASETALVASEMRDRVIWGEEGAAREIWTALEKAEVDPKQKPGDLNTEELKELFDAYMLLSSINVDYHQAVSASGQELIEKKLSKMESM